MNQQVILGLSNQILFHEVVNSDTDVEAFDETNGQTQTGYFGTNTTILQLLSTERSFTNVLTRNCKRI